MPGSNRVRCVLVLSSVRCVVRVTLVAAGRWRGMSLVGVAVSNIHLVWIMQSVVRLVECTLSAFMDDMWEVEAINAHTRFY